MTCETLDQRDADPRNRSGKHQRVECLSCRWCVCVCVLIGCAMT